MDVRRWKEALKSVQSCKPSLNCWELRRRISQFREGAIFFFAVGLAHYAVLFAVRVNFFRGFKFSLAWWAYTFPMTGDAIATIKYSNEVKNPVTQSLSIILSAISTLTVTALFITTIIHAFVLGDLFPNDIAIAISKRRITDKKNGHSFYISVVYSIVLGISALSRSYGFIKYRKE
ncbi:hypothetical protein IFM89_029838, partial [Coptis chinensis]